MASPQIFEDLSSGFSILLQKKSEHTFLCYPLFQDYLNLLTLIENDPELRSKFTPEQIKDIEEGRTPSGYVWHHNEEPGKMQLVKREDHDRVIGGAAHTGGNSLWGADSVDNSKKGESF